VRVPDQPERGGRSDAVSLRDRLDSLPANHPSSPAFAADAGPGRIYDREHAIGNQDRPKQERCSGGLDRRGDGFVDQRARTFLPAELAIAEVLADNGAAVVALVEDHSRPERQPDALVDGRVTEFKSLSRGASDATVKNQLRTARGQAPNVVIDARGSGLAEDSAALGLRRFLGTPWAKDCYASIVVLGDDYMIDAASPKEPRDE
jgi:contact-dependent growth inhibition (CDI) system CdiA-like toxin